MDRLGTLESLIRLATIERSSPPSVRESLNDVRERLEGDLGGTVRPSEAARILGVSPPALKRWLDKGEIATVLTRTGRREIPTGELIDLSFGVEQARENGRARALSAVINERRRRAEELDIDDLLPRRRGRTHRDAERQSLAYHRAIAGRLTSDMIREAGRRIDRLERSGQLNPHWADEWRRVLKQPLPRVAKALGVDSVRMRELRQTSPFAGLLTEQERLRLLDAADARR